MRGSPQGSLVWVPEVRIAFSSMNAWDLVKRRLESKLSEDSFHNWVSKTAFKRLEGNILWVLTPNEQTKRWMEEEYGDLVYQCCSTLELGIDRIIYEVGKVATAQFNRDGDLNRDTPVIPHAATIRFSFTAVPEWGRPI
jgi:chromosomal replication initiation ATPase DnaA